VYGGRWNNPGTAIVYTSGTVSLAALELFVNLDPDTSPDDLVALTADVPEELTLRRIEVADLPRNWQRFPAPPQLKSIGDTWARSGKTAVLVVPSAVIPHESNYLLNPAHPDFSRIRILKSRRFRFDPRMWGKQPG
jgi:RES domain-containing protein